MLEMIGTMLNFHFNAVNCQDLIRSKQREGETAEKTDISVFNTEISSKPLEISDFL